MSTDNGNNCDHDVSCAADMRVTIFELAENYKGLLTDAIEVFNEYSREESVAKSQLIQAGFVTRITEWADSQRTVFEEREDLLVEQESLLRNAFSAIFCKVTESETALPESVTERLALLMSASRNLTSDETVQALALVTARLMVSCKDVINCVTEQNLVAETEAMVQELRAALEVVEQTLSEIASKLMGCLEKAYDCARLILGSIQSEFINDPDGGGGYCLSASDDGLFDIEEERNGLVADPAAWRLLAVLSKHEYAERMLPAYGLCIAKTTLTSVTSSTATAQDGGDGSLNNPPARTVPACDNRSETRGYIYAMINPSIKGMIKVGKTKRDPEERARELSAHTGVPTAYMVAYAVEVGDCDCAERYVHSKLAEKNHRVSNNREFFSASLSDIVSIMMEAETRYGADTPKSDKEYSFSRSGTSVSGEAVELFERAEELLWDAGDDDSFREARELLKRSAKLGYGKAYYALGTIFDHGLGVQRNPKQAQSYYTEAVHAGFAQANIAVATICARQGDIESAFDYWKSYLREIESYNRLGARSDVFFFIGHCYNAKKTPPQLKRLSFLRDDLLRFGQECIDNENRGSGFKAWAKKINGVIEQQVPLCENANNQNWPA